MRYGRYGYPHILMRVGLGLVFLWIGIDIVRTPDSWIVFLPQVLPFGLTRETALQLTGAFDIILGLLLISGRIPKLAALLAGLHLAGIVIANGVDAVTIRDVSLLATALALFVWPYHRRKKRWWSKKPKRSSSSDDDEK